MAMQLIDTHCHLDVEDFDPDRAEIIARCKALGIVGMVVPGIHMAGMPGLIELCAKEDILHPALGLHPIYLDQHKLGDVEALVSLVEQVHPVAIGEIGLDYYVQGLDPQRQQTLFEAQLAIARDADLPVVLHIRKAYDQVLATLRRMRLSKGIAHAFSGSMQQAQQFVDLGFRLGFGGTVTYERSNRIRCLAHELPLSAIVLETDAPDIPTANHRGERNSPEYLPEVLHALAEVRGEEPAYIAAQTTRNAQFLLGLY